MTGWPTNTSKIRSYTTMDKLRELEREIAMRERVYKKWLEAVPPRIHITTAARQMGILKAIAEDYRELLTDRPLVHVEEDREEA